MIEVTSGASTTVHQADLCSVEREFEEERWISGCYERPECVAFERIHKHAYVDAKNLTWISSGIGIHYMLGDVVDKLEHVASDFEAMAKDLRKIARKAPTTKAVLAEIAAKKEAVEF
jgi:hypothetical protein